MSIEDTIRHNRAELASTINEYLDQLEVASAGLVHDAESTIAKIRQLVDKLVDNIEVPDLAGLATRLDRHAADLLLDHDDYAGAREVIETAEAFARRQYQIDSAAELAEWKKDPAHFHYHVEDMPEAVRREHGRQEAADRPR